MERKRALFSLIGLPVESVCDEVVETISNCVTPVQEKSPKNASEQV